MALLKRFSKKQILISIVIFIGIILFLFFYQFFYNENKVYVSKEYNSKGQLIGINEYVIQNNDTILNGKFERYNDKGILISKGQFLNDEVYGKCLYYYDNGVLESTYYKKSTDITLEAMWNYPNGQLEKYVMYTDFGKPLFIIKYDKKHIVDSYKGRPQLEIYQHKVDTTSRNYKQIKYSFKIGDTLKYTYLVANIPNAKRSFTIENVGIDNAKVKRITKKVEPCQLDVKEVLTKKGKNTIRSIVKYEFNDKVTPVFTDTLTFNVDVN